MDAERSSGCQGLPLGPNRLEVLSADGHFSNYFPCPEDADMSGFGGFDRFNLSLKEGVPA